MVWIFDVRDAIPEHAQILSAATERTRRRQIVEECLATFTHGFKLVWSQRRYQHVTGSISGRL